MLLQTLSVSGKERNMSECITD